MDTTKVTCGIIYKDEKVFICRRKKEKPLGGYWEFPGGKVEPGESYENCLQRELLEELEMNVEVLDHFKTVLHSYDNFKIELISFRCNFTSSRYALHDHDMYEWVAVKDLSKWKLAPADIPIADALISNERGEI